MTPITFSCKAIVGLAPVEIAERILDVSNWLEFKGYAFIPGIKTTKFEVRTPEGVGSRIRVTNTDGSSHVEEIVEWHAEQRLTLIMKEFSPPLSRLATSFEETFEFEPINNATRVTRSFKLHARSQWARMVLWPISWFLKRAITRHLEQMRQAASERLSAGPTVKKVVMSEFEYVDPRSLVPGPIRHESLPPELLETIQTVYGVIGPYFGSTLEQFEIGFMRDAHPDREVALWCSITAAWLNYHEKFLNDQVLSDPEEKKLLGALIVISTGARDVERLGVPAETAVRLLKCYDSLGSE